MFGIAQEEAQKWAEQGGKHDAQETFDVFPENWNTVLVFLALQTQWNVAVGMAGGIRQGLKYEVLPVVFDLMAVPKEERSELFEGLRLMEREALKILNQTEAKK